MPGAPRGRFKWPFGIVGATPTLWDRFWAKVDMTGGPKACWPYTGALRTRRRGKRGNHQVGGRGSRTVSADRLALALHTDGNLNRRRGGVLLQCCHRCGNGDGPIYCVNPTHEYWGTQTQNERDKKRKVARELAAAVLEARAGREAGRTTEHVAVGAETGEGADGLADATPQHVARARAQDDRRRDGDLADLAARHHASGAAAANRPEDVAALTRRELAHR